MIVAIHQPNYAPWLGYFAKIAAADIFVFFDHVQMPIGKSFVSRNRVKTDQGVRWLTVPTRRDSAGARIADTPIVPGPWPRKHAKTIAAAYAGSPWLEDVIEAMERCFAAGHVAIADLNIALVRELATLLDIDGVRFQRATEMDLEADDGTAIPEILEKTGATTYLTGVGAGSLRYLDPVALKARGIETQFVANDFGTYSQRHGPFEPNLSIIDALLNCGPATTRALLA